jgi:hypothetical protein
MLIDLEKDPGETTNLAADRSHRARLEEGRRMLAAWHRENDVALDPGYVV